MIANPQALTRSHVALPAAGLIAGLAMASPNLGVFLAVAALVAAGGFFVLAVALKELGRRFNLHLVARGLSTTARRATLLAAAIGTAVVVAAALAAPWAIGSLAT